MGISYGHTDEVRVRSRQPATYLIRPHLYIMACKSDEDDLVWTGSYCLC